MFSNHTSEAMAWNIPYISLQHVLLENSLQVEKMKIKMNENYDQINLHMEDELQILRKNHWKKHRCGFVLEKWFYQKASWLNH
jgi:hypothetical protein